MVLDRIATFGHNLTRSTAEVNRAQRSSAFAPRTSFYDLQDAYAANEVYRHHRLLMNTLKSERRLPKNIRPIYNPALEILEWWITHILVGVWTEDGLPDEGKPNLIPYASNTPEELRLMVQQGFDWGNADVTFEQWMHDEGLYGNVFVKVDWSTGPGGDVSAAVIDPRYIQDLQVSRRNDVTLYHIELPTIGPDKQVYRWGQKVTPESITTYRDGQPAGYDGNPAEVENPFGFVPAHWGYFRYQGGIFGRTCLDGLHGKIDEINAVVTQLNNFLMQLPNQPTIVASNDPKGLKTMLAEMQAGSSAFGDVDDDTLRVIAAGETARAFPLLQDWGIAGADPHIGRMLENLYKAVPEVTLSEKLLDMQQVTQPGALPLVQNVQTKYNRVASNTFNGVVKIGQMFGTIGGALANQGLWGPTASLTDAQRKFLPFNLDSYHKGDLNFSVTIPDLVPASLMQKIQEAAAREGLTTIEALKHTGLDDEQAQAWLNARNAALDADQQRRNTGSILNFNAGGL
jgi:hypothetical protein